MSLLLFDSGSGGGTQVLAGTVTGSSTVAGSVAIQRPLAGAITGTATSAYKITIAHALGVTVTGSCLVTAQFGGNRQLAAAPAGTCVVTAKVAVSHALKATSAGIDTVSASLFVEGITANVTGVCTVAATNLKITRHLQANLSGSSTVEGTAKLVLGLRGTSSGLTTVIGFTVVAHKLSGTVTGSCTGSANLGRFYTRGAVSNLSIISQYQQFVEFLMLVDPAFQSELGTVPTAQTFTFVKKVVKGLFYVDILGSGSILSCQVKTGDGQNYSTTTNVAVRIISSFPLVSGILVTAGTAIAGAGTNACWVQTTPSGSFSLAITGSGSILVEAFPKQGVAMSAGIFI